MTIRDELALLEKFQKLYMEFPEGIVTKTESPDFIVATKTKRIGIETTEVFQDSHIGTSKLQQQSSDHSLFVENLIKRIQLGVPFTFHIGVHFSRFHPLRKNRKEQLYNQVLPLCVSALKTLLNKQSIDIYNFELLPDEIDRIYLGRYDGMKESFNTQTEGGSVSDFSDIHLEAILSKKHARLQKYQPCDEYWLLIKEGNYYAGTFDTIKLSNPVISEFSNIFLLRTSKSELLYLK